MSDFDEQQNVDGGGAERSERPAISLLAENVPQALQDLADCLEHAFRGPVQSIDHSRSEVVEEQRRMADALVGVANFLRAIDPNGAEFANRFFTLAVALSQLETGRVSSILSPYNGPGRRPDSPAIWARRTMVALAIECLLRSGMEARQAAAEIAREPQLSSLVRDKADVSTSKALKSPRRKLESSCLKWHQLAIDGTHQNDTVRGTWKAGIQYIDATQQQNLSALARGFIAAAQDPKNFLNPHL